MRLSEPAPTVDRVGELTSRQRDILDFERGWSFRHPGSKDAAIRELFGCSAWRYAQELNALIDVPAAYVAEPSLVKRLRRLRAERQRQRAG